MTNDTAPATMTQALQSVLFDLVTEPGQHSARALLSSFACMSRQPRVAIAFECELRAELVISKHASLTPYERRTDAAVAEMIQGEAEGLAFGIERGFYT